MSKIVIIGAGYAGLLAAMRLNRQHEHQVTLINVTDQFVERIRLHQTAAYGYNAEHAISKLLAGTRIEFRQAWVSAVRPDQHQIVLGENSETLHYDRLLYALGSTTGTRTPGVKEHAFTLANTAEANRLQAAMSGKSNGRLLVIGAGLTGIEASTELAERFPGWQVTLVEMGQFGGAFAPRGEGYLRDAFKRRSITLIENSRISRLEAGSAVVGDGRSIPFDACLWTGAFGVSPLARDSGFSVDGSGRILVDETLRSVSHPHVYAAGDAASIGLRMACATAMPMGAHTADNLLADLNGQGVKPFRFAFGGRCISLGRRDALVQLVRPDDSPVDRIVTGRAGALAKELICLFTINSIRLEKRLPGSYLYPRGELSAALQPMKTVRSEA